MDLAVPPVPHRAAARYRALYALTSRRRLRFLSTEGRDRSRRSAAGPPRRPDQYRGLEQYGWRQRADAAQRVCRRSSREPEAIFLESTTAGGAAGTQRCPSRRIRHHHCHRIWVLRVGPVCLAVQGLVRRVSFADPPQASDGPGVAADECRLIGWHRAASGVRMTGP